MNKPLNPAARKTGLVIQEALDELLVYDMGTNKAHCLNKTAAYVWQACNGSRNVSEIAEFVSSQAGEKVSDDLVWLAIDQLNENDLLEKAVEAQLNGMSRRDVIKKIGLTSMVALPVIASLVAPPTAMASTSCNCVSDLACQAAPNLDCPSTTCNSTGLCRP
ncbi:MAG TPA: PqqD family protein [Pyrinomonadaceae bacterium]|nr:PqqD family protein [Pyrinomonadaceae bacterium]